MNTIVYVGRHPLTKNVVLHAHATWELVYCTSGSGGFYFDDTEIQYAQGEIVVIPPMVPHRNRSEEGFTNIHINMADAAFSFHTPVLIQDDGNHLILNAFQAAFIHYCGDPNRQQVLLSPLGDLLCAYLMTYQDIPALTREVEEIERHILEHYTDCNYELDKYLQSLPFSYDYLRKLFKKEMGMTPHKYLINKRLQTASDMLCMGYCGGENNITEIALLCGFREPLYFSRMFKKKFGVAPSYYMEAVRAKQSGQKLDSDSTKIKLEPTDV